MAEEIISPIVPNLAAPNFSITPATLNLLIIGLIISVVLLVLWKLHKNRIYVDLYEKVTSGYVSRPGRYRIIYDRTTKMHSLVSMFGGGRLPAFKSEHFQKVNATPFIGIQRQIKLLKVNKHTYFPILPPPNKEMLADVQEYSSLTWVRTEILKKFEKKINSGQLLYILSVAAPCIVIVSAIVFLIIAMYTDQYLLHTLVNKIDQITSALTAVVTKGG